ncbi:MAG TPA: PPOX class F420-dependent oxidoreductase [Mycobacteriales bacterium]|nr:PPOX class F420-dependent oxidoreductase [Mycobacteriales bacterium]
MDLEQARDYIRSHHRAILATVRRDGTPQMSPVAVTVDTDGYAVVSSRETAIKVKNLRRDPRAWICAFPDSFYGEPFVQVEGDVTIVSLPEAMDGLFDYYRSISGEHPDWDEYRAAMTKEQRVLIKVALTRAGPDAAG